MFSLQEKIAQEDETAAQQDQAAKQYEGRSVQGYEEENAAKQQISQYKCRCDKRQQDPADPVKGNTGAEQNHPTD